MTAPCHHGGPAPSTPSDPSTLSYPSTPDRPASVRPTPSTVLLAPDGQSGLGIEELHVFDVDGEGHPVAGLDRGLGLDAGHALALFDGRGLVFIERTLGYDPVRVDGEVDH